MMWHGVNSCASPLLIALLLVAAGAAFPTGTDSLPPLRDGKVPQSLDELWGGYDPRAERSRNGSGTALSAA